MKIQPEFSSTFYKTSSGTILNLINKMLRCWYEYKFYDSVNENELYEIHMKQLAEDN